MLLKTIPAKSRVRVISPRTNRVYPKKRISPGEALIFLEAGIVGREALCDDPCSQNHIHLRGRLAAKLGLRPFGAGPIKPRKVGKN